jgi:hypothetical protein
MHRTLTTQTRTRMYKNDSARMTGKIALEEHFALLEAGDIYNTQPAPEFRQQMQDMGSGRLAEMDRGGVELCILSHVGPGVQALRNSSEAIATSRRWNDYLAEYGKESETPERIRGLAHARS